MELKIKQLTIENFKGISGPLTVNFNGTLTYVYADNHVGKTTLMDAMMWLLFGKNSQGETTFGIDPTDEDNNIIHNLENTVKATFTVDGDELSLQRTRKEVWKKQRGLDTETYSHTTAYYVDGDKLTEKEYKTLINEQLMPEDIFKALTTPAYFPSLKADEQRGLLIAMVGDVTNEDAAAGEPALQKCLKEMGDRSLEDYKRHIGYKIKEIKAELDTLPGRISENTSALGALREGTPDFEQVRADVKETDNELTKVEEQLADLSKTVEAKYDTLTEERRQLNAIKDYLKEIEQDTNRRNGKAWSDHEDAVARLSANVRSAQIQADGYSSDTKQYSKQLAQLEVRKKDFRSRWQEVEDMAFVWDGDENCPTCGQRLPEDTIEANKVRALGSFNKRKQAAQDELDETAKSIKAEENRLQALIADTQRKAAESERKAAQLEQELTDLQQAPPQKIDYHELDSYQAAEQNLRYKAAAIKAIEEAATHGDDGKEAAKNELLAKRTELNQQRDRLRDQLAKEESINRHAKRIEELEEQVKALNQQLTEYEQREDSAQELNRRKTEMLQSKVNRLFSLVKFKMFNKLMNGNLEPTCECMMHGIPYRDLSNSEKINAGLDILNVMCEKHGHTAPVWIDNAESCNEILPTVGQQIQLTVSTDKELKIII